MRTVPEIIQQAIEYHGRGDVETAEHIYEQLLCQLDYADPNVFLGYGTILVSKQKYGLGILMLQMGLRLYDKHPLGWTNLGVALKHIGKDAEALKAYERAYAINPEMPEVLASLAGYYINRSMPEQAEDFARKALALNPTCHGANMNLGVALLEQGRYAEAWPHYESRWESLDRAKDKRPYKAPRWKGEKVKTLAIHGEQGLGDEILFMSALSKVRPLADNIVIECADRLVKIFRESFGLPCYPTHEALIAEEGEPSAYIPMGSLFSVVGMPDGKPYLKRPNVVKTGKPVIGIAWKGGTMKTNHRDRSLDIEDLVPIFGAIDAHFVSVQYGGDDVDEDARRFGLIVGPRDFDSLQFRIGTCDLVISVLQTAIHQAGSMGVPCWALTPNRYSWPFGGGTERMNFYDCVRLFRQDASEQWSPVIARIASELKDMSVDLAA